MAVKEIPELASIRQVFLSNGHDVQEEIERAKILPIIACGAEADVNVSDFAIHDNILWKHQFCLEAMILQSRSVTAAQTLYWSHRTKR